jgi:predicted nucleotidyltransferase
VGNVEFLVGEVETLIPRMYKEGIKADVVVVDPPRKGCDEKLLDTLVEMQPQRIVYVSCNPATLARDLKYLGERGFEAEEAQPVDMFPWTGHVECVVLIERMGKEFYKEKIDSIACKDSNINDSIINFAKKFNLNKVVLFGSRARGDNKPRSDIDIAIWMDGNSFDKANVLNEIEEIETLLKIDLVIIDDNTENELLNSIINEGVLIYERYK